MSPDKGIASFEREWRPVTADLLEGGGSEVLCFVF